MAGEKTQAEVDAQILAGIRVNGNKEITPPIHAAIEYALSNSYVNKKDAGLVIQALLGYTTDLTPTDDKHLTPKKYVDDLVGAIDYWDITGNTLASRGTFGSISGSFGWDYKINNTKVGEWTNGGLFSALNGMSTDGVLSLSLDTVNARYKIGEFAGSGDSGANNFWGGTYAGFNNIASRVTGISRNAAAFNEGYDLIAIGVDSGQYNLGLFCQFYGKLGGFENEGDECFGFGFQVLYQNIADNVFGVGSNAARENTFSKLFTVSNLTDIFWNNVGDKGYTTLQAVTMQTAMAPDGTNQSAAASISKWAPARGTGSADSGYNVIQKANIQASGTTRHTLTDWWFFEGQGNFGFGGQSYGSGVGVFAIANAGTDASANPTGGFVLQSKSGRAKVYETDGSLSFLVKAVASTKTTAGAPYTNDGYVEIVIDGVTLKVMTTA